MVIQNPKFWNQTSKGQFDKQKWNQLNWKTQTRKRKN
jgi:hypothetical protein